jgi:ribonuclease P protein component
MLPRPHRLRSRREFQRVYRQGRSWAHPLLALHLLAGDSGKRVGISVSKKVGKAAGRNRVRRRLREAARGLLPDWKEGVDAVIVARAAAAEAGYHDLAAALAELSRRARLLREPGEAPDSLYTMPAGGRPGARRAGGAGPGAQGRRERRGAPGKESP